MTIELVFLAALAWITAGLLVAIAFGRVAHRSADLDDEAEQALVSERANVKFFRGEPRRAAPSRPATDAPVRARRQNTKRIAG